MTPRSFLSAGLALLLFSAAAAFAQTPKPPAVPDLAVVHEEVGQLDCKDCHGPKKRPPASAEEELRTVNASCMKCHGSAAVVAAKITPKLANKHVNPHAGHVVSIECVTCHVAHDAPSKAYCQNCHAFDMPMALRHAARPAAK